MDNNELLEKRLKNAFSGHGGGIVERYFYEALNKKKGDAGFETLDSIIKDIVVYCNMDDGEECPKVPENFKDEYHKISWINEYLENIREHNPEICGTIAGIIMRDISSQSAVDFLWEGFDEYCERTYWDS
jgi:hypothetical protein